MDSFMKQIKQESSKLVDINSVLAKLNDKGYIQKMGSLFEQIFQEEQSFTVQELSRLMKNLSKDRYFDMNMQFKMNTSIFKANFDVIVGIIMNNVWNRITDEFQQTSENQKNNFYNQQEQKILSNDNIGVDSHSNRQNDLNQQQTQQQQLQQQQQQQQQGNQQQQTLQQQMSDSGIKKQLISNNSMQFTSNFNVSAVNNSATNINQNDSWVRKSMKSGGSSANGRQNSGSAHNVNKSAIDLYDGRKSQALRNSNISLSQIQRKKNTSNLQNTSKMSISSVRSAGSASKLGGTVPFSELSVMHDSQYRSNSPGLNSSFSRAPRELDRSNYDSSPGPSDYNVNKSNQQTRKQSPSTKFGKSARLCWIDEKLRYDSSVQTPGAKYDAVKLHTSKPIGSKR